VIVISPSVARDPSLPFILLEGGFCVGGKRMPGIVVQQANDNAADPGHSRARIFATGIEKVFHFARITARKPIRSVFQLGKFFRAHYAAQVETGTLCLLDNPSRVCSFLHPEDCAPARSRMRASENNLVEVTAPRTVFAGLPLWHSEEAQLKLRTAELSSE